MSKIAPCIWFATEAEEAANFYVSLLPNSRVVHVQKSPADNPGGKAGSVLVVYFELAGQGFMGLNGRHEARIHPLDLVHDRLQGSGRGRPAVGRAARRWRRDRRVRLAEGPLRRIVADHTDRPAEIAGRSRSRQGQTGDAGHDGDDQDRRLRP